MDISALLEDESLTDNLTDDQAKAVYNLLTVFSEKDQESYRMVLSAMRRLNQDLSANVHKMLLRLICTPNTPLWLIMLVIKLTKE